MCRVLSLAVVLVVFGFGQGMAQPYGMQNSLQDRARDAVQAGEFVPLADIVQRLQRRTPGRLLDAQLRREVYRIEWLSQDGRRIDYRVHAGTGRILSVRGE